MKILHIQTHLRRFTACSDLMCAIAVIMGILRPTVSRRSSS